MNALNRTALGLFCLTIAAGAAEKQSAKTPASDLGLAAIIQQYQADGSGVSSFYDLPWSSARFDRMDKLFTGWQERLKALDFDSLEHDAKVDYVLLRNDIELSLFQIAQQRKRLADMEQLLPFHTTITDLENARWHEAHIDGAAAATKVSDITKQVKQIKERVEKGKKEKSESEKKEPPKEKKSDELPAIVVAPGLALRSAGAVGELRETLKKWFKYYDGFNPQISWWLKKPCQDADKALEEYGKFLKEEVAGQKGKDEDPLVGNPIGADAVAKMIGFEFLPYTAEELIAIGERELAWGEKEMKLAARQMGFGDDWKAALAKVKSDHVAPGDQDELINKIAKEALAFTKKHRFVTVPPLCEETWRLTMMSPETLKSIPYAAYAGQSMLVAYANESMKQEDKLMVMRGNNRAFAHLTTPHELIPGHHLQIFQASRHRNYRQMFSTPFYVEGWALYCELRFWELGWSRTPADRIGMLFWRMTRAARIVVTLKFHLGQMKPKEMVDLLMNRVGHEKFGATSEVRRFITAEPLYQCGYLIGGRQIHALHDELVPRRMTEQQFSDGFLMENTMPIEMARAALLKQPLTRDTRPAWRFDEGQKP